MEFVTLATTGAGLGGHRDGLFGRITQDLATGGGR